MTNFRPAQTRKRQPPSGCPIVRVRLCTERQQLPRGPRGDRTGADDKLRTDLTEQTSQVEQLARGVAVDGLVLQGQGWVLVFIGVVLGSLGNILQSLAG